MSPQPLKLEDITRALLSYHPSADVDLVKKAYLYAADHHKGQMRDSGEEYIIHPLHVARIVCELKLDEKAVTSALLHDTIEDTGVSHEEVAELFGTQVADIVQGVTNLSKMNFSSREERQAENFRKMLLAMAKDIRVILVKLADRLHNMRTLQHSDPSKWERKSQETMEIYAPLANRLGLYWLKSELEDLCFRYVNAPAYDELEEKLAAGEKQRRRFLKMDKEIIEREVREAGLANAEVYARHKFRYSIYRKMQRQNVPFEKVFDVVAFRVLVDSVEQCWQVLGMVHQLWKPIPGRFRYFVSLPKPNGYRSLHTSVIGPTGDRMEVQVRTHEMHEMAERGIAAHWKYKDGRVISPADEERIRYLKHLIEELLDLNETVGDSVELYSAIKEGLSFDEIFVFTPKGDVKNLPMNGTPVDFAFSIHTQVGFTCTGARVNGVMVQLTHELKNGDVVEILTNPKQKPSQDWLRFVKSSRAKAKIRRVLRSEARARFLQLGKVLMEKELKTYGITLNKISKNGQLKKLCKNKLGTEKEERLYFRVGSGRLEAQDMARQIAEEIKPEAVKKEAETPPVMRPITGIFERMRLSGRGKVLVGGEGDVAVKFGKCCNPIGGEPIVGFVTRGRGITVHAVDCQYVQVMEPERLVDVEWDRGSSEGREVTLKVTSFDSPGMLTKMSQVFSSMGLNINQAVVRTTDKRAENVFKVTIQNVSQLKSIIRALQRIEGVERVERVKG
jgi:GTP diphosphokinase / guanosine-3',5'-bis(diphosphate) 3'-diphosphatase